jgi:tetratricopeptide (TPR) repeat protein
MADNQTGESSLWEPKSYLDGHPLDQPGHYEEALNVYNGLIARDSRNIIAYILQGRTLRNLKRIEEAQTSLLHAIQLAEQALGENPKNVRASIYRADALSLLRQREEALVAYDQAIQLAPDDYEAYLNKGWTQMVLGHYHEALTLFQRAHDLRPDDADILWRMNIAYWHMKQYNKSVEMLEQAIAIDPTQSRFYGDLATALDSLGRHEEATNIEAQAEAMEAQSLAEALAQYQQMGLGNT